MTEAQKKAAAAKVAAEAQKKAAAAAEAVAKAPTSGEDWNDDAPVAEAESEFDGPVAVRCIVHSRPFTDKKGLVFGEEATVPAEVAEAMLNKKQVELV